jgi:hypothetical protein
MMALPLTARRKNSLWTWEAESEDCPSDPTDSTEQDSHSTDILGPPPLPQHDSIPLGHDPDYRVLPHEFILFCPWCKWQNCYRVAPPGFEGYGCCGTGICCKKEIFYHLNTANPLIDQSCVLNCKHETCRKRLATVLYDDLYDSLIVRFDNLWPKAEKFFIPSKSEL